MQPARYVAIVDDDASMREALARLLRVHGIISRSYPSAQAFLKEVCFAKNSARFDASAPIIN
jgi:FixJ family two-component response regulator